MEVRFLAPEEGDRRERRQLAWLYRRSRSACMEVVEAPVEGDRLTVELVERSEAEVAVLFELAVALAAAVHGIEEGRDG